MPTNGLWVFIGKVATKFLADIWKHHTKKNPKKVSTQSNKSWKRKSTTIKAISKLATKFQTNIYPAKKKKRNAPLSFL